MTPDFKRLDRITRETLRKAFGDDLEKAIADEYGAIARRQRELFGGPQGATPAPGNGPRHALVAPGEEINDPKAGIPHTEFMKDGLEEGGAIYRNMAAGYGDAFGSHSGTILHPVPQGSHDAEQALRNLKIRDPDEETGYHAGNMHLVAEEGHYPWAIDSANRRIYDSEGHLHSTYEPGEEETAFTKARADHV